jgi:DNA damage-binding protein 1
MFSASHENSSVMRLDKICSYRTATAPIDISVTGNIIAVTDLMKSLSLIEYKPGIAGISGTLTEVARHFDTLWGTSVANVAENTYLQSDAEGNLVVLQHEVNGFNASDRRRLRVTSEMLLGEMVNRIRRIDVVPTAGAVVIPRAFLATVEGSIYLFALIAPGKQDLLIRMQTKMAEMVQTPGNVPFGRFRGVKTQVRDMGEEGPNRFVDGELIERFLDCPPEIQLEIAKELEVDVEDLKLMVENLRRIH